MNFDIAMPLTLFAVTTTSLFLNKKVEGKLKSTLEEKEFKPRDVIFLIAAMATILLIIIFIPSSAIMTVFLLAYSSLLFIFTYLFSDFKKFVAEIICLIFLALGLTIATITLLNADFFTASLFYGLSAFALISLVYENKRKNEKERWYLAVLPSALFIFLYLAFNGTSIWFPYLFDLYGLIFAVLITLYLGSLFTWKTSLLFVGILTVFDIVMVFTGPMVSAAKHIVNLWLPVAVSVPTVPPIILNGKRVSMLLGLGDFFFAGLLAIQTFKKFGRNFSLLSILGMITSFFLFETFIVLPLGIAFPGTLMIICGWIPLIFIKKVSSNVR